MHRLLAAAAISLALITGAHADRATSCSVTKAQYETLPGRITYADAVKHFGCEGSEMSSTEVSGTKMVMFQWDGTVAITSISGEIPTSAAMLMFMNGKLYTKSQYGLK